MIGKRYTAQFKIDTVEEYLNGPKKTMASFAAEKGISDSTFNDWVLKYKRQGKDFCNVTTELLKMNDVVESKMETIVDDAPISENRVRLQYNGAVVEFDESLLEKVLKIVKSG